MYKSFLIFLPTILLATTNTTKVEPYECYISSYCGVNCLEEVENCILNCDNNCNIIFTGTETNLFLRNSSNIGLLIENKTNIHISGLLNNIINKPKLLLHGINTFFTFKNCKNITIDNLLFELYRTPFTAGIINNVNYVKSTFGLLLNDIESYSFPGSLYLNDGENYDYLYNIKSINGYDSINDQFIEPNINDIDYDIIEIDEQHHEIIVKVKNPNILNELTNGDYIVLRHTMDEYNVMNFIENEDITLSELDILNGGGTALDFFKNINIILDSIKINKGINKPMSVNNKGINMELNKGEISIIDSFFSGLGDMAFNIHNFFFEITNFNKSEVNITRNNLDEFLAPFINIGDIFEFRNRQTLQTYFKSKLIDFDFLTNTATFVDPIPVNKVNINDVISSTNAEPNNVNIINNIFKESLSVANNIKTSSVNLINNVYEKITGSAILINCDAGKNLESSVSQSVIISNNNFTDCNYGYNNNNGTIMITATVPEYNKNGQPTGNDIPLKSGQIHNSVKIKGNRINNSYKKYKNNNKYKKINDDISDESIVSIRAVRGFYIKENIITLPQLNFAAVQEFNDLIPSVVRANECKIDNGLIEPCIVVRG